MSEEITPLPGLTNPTVLLESMAAKGVTGDELAKMMDFLERLQSNQSAIAFAEAHNKCQQEMPLVLKTVKNNFLDSVYANLESVQNLCKPVWTKHGFSLSFSEGDLAPNGMRRIIMTVRHVGGKTEVHHGNYPTDGTGAKGGKNMNALQGVVSSNTYAQRDMIRNFFGIVIAGQDFDGNQVELLTPEHVQELNQLFEQCEQNGNPVNMEAFWKFVGCKDMYEMRDRDFPAAKDLLKRKAARK